MRCAYQCYEIGGPWIAENPHCPVHGHEAQKKERVREWEKSQLLQRIVEAQTVEDLQACLCDIVEMI